MRARQQDGFTTIRTEGAVLPRDLLTRIVAGDKQLGGLTADDYHLSGEKLNEATNRAWNRLQGAWAVFRRETDPLRPEVCSAGANGAGSALDPGTSPTRERWLLPLFQELGYGRLPTAKARDIDGRTYAISHTWGNVPIHLVGLNVDLDRQTPGVAGAARSSPHSLLQELLNRSDEHLWGFVSNGLRLRILRDNRSLTRQAYVEFDLEAMMNGEAYADFGLLYLLCHQSRVEGERPEECWLERWSRAAEAQGTRALDQLRKGVEEAISALGAGFLAHPENGELRRKLEDGELSAHDYYRDLLRLVYRLLFLFVAEDRGLLFDPAAPPKAKELYTRFYSTARIRRLAERRRGGRHSDLYQGLRLVMRKLGEDAGCPELGLPALGSFLFTEAGPAELGSLDIANRDLLAAVRGLAFTQDRNIRRAIDYRNLGSEELGSVYEALLELHPEVNVPARTFALVSGGGSERKSTGSYYTPTSLIQCLLDSALDPVVAEALRKPDPEQALLDLKVCDPACGSGHFLVAAAHRIAKRLAALRTGDEEPSPEAQREALRAVIGRCLYGVDVNPMAVELCKVSLWMEALEPGKPLSFLEHRILCGNSLLGATPALLGQGIPDEAFQALEGDDKKVVSELRKQNRQQREGQETLFVGTSTAGDNVGLARILTDIDHLADDSLSAVRAKEERYQGLSRSAEYRRAKLAADAWCSAFVCRKTPGMSAITHDVFVRLSRDPESVPQALRDEIERLAGEYRFFHWHLAFPEVLTMTVAEGAVLDDGPSWSGGFDMVLGNPPWLSLTGRQKVTLRFGEVNLLSSLYPAISRWPATHSAFLLRSLGLARPNGFFGFVLPLQLSDLDSYGPVRAEVAQAVFDGVKVLDVGEDAFIDVNQPVGLYSARIEMRQSPHIGHERWKTDRAPWLGLSGNNGQDRSRVCVGEGSASEALLQVLGRLPRFPSQTFSDPGVHTGNVSALIVKNAPGYPEEAWALVREGRDIESFNCRAARKWLLTVPDLKDGQYCRIRAFETYARTPILLRQTANRPIAAMHRSATYFRNSLLACHGLEGIPDTVLVAALNSTLLAFAHRTQFGDSNQKVFPQVKVKHLRNLPMFEYSRLECRTVSSGCDGRTIEEALTQTATEIEEAKTAGRLDLLPAIFNRLDRLVLELYALDLELLNLLTARVNGDAEG